MPSVRLVASAAAARPSRGRSRSLFNQISTPGSDNNALSGAGQFALPQRVSKHNPVSRASSSSNLLGGSQFGMGIPPGFLDHRERGYLDPMPARGNRGLRVLHRCGKLSLHLLGEFEALGGESCPVNPEVGMFTGRGTAARLDQGAIEGSVAGFVSVSYTHLTLPTTPYV